MGAQNEDTETRMNGRSAVGIALYLAPDANAVQTAGTVQRVLHKRLGQRFPPGLKAHVVYDSTVFVSDIIHEVLVTLAEAFGLVVIVVFLFLGNLRATIIPAVAVPVSLIGTFAVLLLLGYSANTVSPARHGAGDRHRGRRCHRGGGERRAGARGAPRMSPAERPSRRCRQITGPIIAITLVLLSVFVPVAFHSPRSPPIVPPVRRHHQRRHADLGAERTDPVAGRCAPCSCGTSPGSAGRSAWSSRIDGVRDGYAWMVRRLVRVGVVSLLLVLGLRLRHPGPGADDADQLPAGGGPGRLLPQRATARRRLGRPHQRDGAPGRGDAEGDAAGAGHLRGEIRPRAGAADGLCAALANIEPNFNSSQAMKGFCQVGRADQTSPPKSATFSARVTKLKNGRGGPVIVEIPADMWNEEVPEPLNYTPVLRHPLRRRPRACDGGSRAVDRRQAAGDLCRPGRALCAGLAAASAAGRKESSAPPAHAPGRRASEAVRLGLRTTTCRRGLW